VEEEGEERRSDWPARWCLAEGEGGREGGREGGGGGGSGFDGGEDPFPLELFTAPGDVGQDAGLVEFVPKGGREGGRVSGLVPTFTYQENMIYAAFPPSLPPSLLT